MTTIGDLVSVCGSKNAGPYLLTLDLLCKDQAGYEQIKASGLINVERMADLYSLNVDDVRVVEWPIGMAFKIVIPRLVSSGDIEDTDVYGCQQHVPLMQLEIPDPS
jgi:hypothetical protein